MKRAWIRGGIAAAFCTLFGLGVWHLAAADPVAKPPVAVSTSIAECKACHSGPNEIGVRDFKNKFKSDEFIRLDESKIWDEKDPHSKAYDALAKSPLAKSMSEKLKYDVLTDSRCLSCHATDTHRPGQRFDVSNGVGCAGCHGVQQDWQTEHYRSKSGTEIEWRKLTGLEKHDKYGLVNLRDPVVKAAVCASCHIGNAAEGKLITHEMYAAGHPPLPPFELMAFSADQPRHWNTPDQLPFFASADDETFKRFSMMKGDDSNARHFLVGAIESLNAEAKLLQHESGEALKKQAGLDYARFDCYACHHDLKGANSDRQKRGYPGAPGRPPLKAWNGALAHAAALFLDDEAAYLKAWDAAQAAAYDKPYGNAKDMLAAAKGLETWCESALGKLTKPITKTQAAALTATIRKMLDDDKTLADPEAAMALVWAYKALTAHDAAAWKDMQKVLPLGPQDGANPQRTQPMTAGELLPERLKRFNDFSIEKFRQQKWPAAK